MLSRHIHPSWVTGYVIKGAWRYLEHDWVASEGSFVYEPPGEIHTLVVDELVGADEMITFFNIHGAMVYVDDAGAVTGYEDVFTKIDDVPQALRRVRPRRGLRRPVRALMARLPGWGLLLAIGMPLLILLGWNRLGGETSRIQLDRYADWSSVHVTPKLLYPLQQHFRVRRTLAGPGDFALPPVPAKSGVKAWSLRPDKVLRVELDAKEGGQAGRAALRSGGEDGERRRSTTASAISAARSSAASAAPSGSSRKPRSRPSSKPTRASCRARRRSRRQAARRCALPARSAASSPFRPSASDLDRCGAQCIKLQRCVTPRPLACGRIVREANTTRQEVVATRDDFRGSSFADAPGRRPRLRARRRATAGTSSPPAACRAPPGSPAATSTGRTTQLRAENNCWR